MIWHDQAPASPSEIDAEQELELRLGAQARAGAGWALSALVARYQPPVVRYLVRLTGNQQTAHALAKQVFVRMGKRLRGPRGGSQLRLWLLRAATEAGLDTIRTPATTMRRRLAAGPGPVGLLAGARVEPPLSRLLTSLGVKAPTRDADREMPRTQEFVWQVAEPTAPSGRDGRQPEADSAVDQMKSRLIRAVLAELPYGDAQCLALHLVAGLNQSEVAQALGLSDLVVRRRIVQGLQLFARRYEASLAGLGLRDDSRDRADDALGHASTGSVVEAASVAVERSEPAGDALPSDLAELAGEAPMPVAASEAASVLPPDTDVPERAEATLAQSDWWDESSQPPADDVAESLAHEAVADSTPDDAVLSGASEWVGGDVAHETAADLAESASDASEIEGPGYALIVVEAAGAPLADLQPARGSEVGFWTLANAPPHVLEEPEPSETADARIETEVSAVLGESVAAEPELHARMLFVVRAPVTRPLPVELPNSVSSLPDPGARDEAPETATAAEDARFIDAAAALGSGSESALVAMRVRRSARLRRVLSADGEAEDPGDEALWPVL